jgi:hypothetical protein
VNYRTPLIAMLEDRGVDAGASITVNNGCITIVLSNYWQNPQSESQGISGLLFAVPGIKGGG